MADLLDSVPWLADGWIDFGTINALGNRPLTDDLLVKHAGWAVPPGIWRRRSKLSQLEGLVLLVGLRGGRAAQVQLARAVDLIDQGLISDRRGTAKRIRRRHPLKNILFELGRPQDMAGMAEALSHVIPKVWAMYPEFGQYLYEAIWPLATGGTSTWAPSMGSDNLFGLDRDECRDSEIAAAVPELDFQPRPLRAFTEADLVDELAVILVELSGEERMAAASLTPVWRGEETAGFYDSVYRISYVATWLQPFLRQRTDLSILQSVSQSIRGKDRSKAFTRVRRWRATKRIEQTTGFRPKALIAPSDQDRRRGIFHLRGLLVLGRLRGVAKTNVGADRQLCELISDLECGSRSPQPVELIADGFPDQHPLEPILDRIGKPRSADALSSILHSLLPEISLTHPVAGRLLGEVYLKLLVNELPTTPDASGRRRSQRQRSGLKARRVHVPTREQVLPGESHEEAEPGLVAYRRSGASKPLTTIKEEIQWVNQKIWGSNPLLIRDHIESVSDVEMSMIIKIIQRRVCADLEVAQHESARIGIVAALTALTGRGPTTFAQADSRLGTVKNGGPRPQLRLREGIFEMPVLRPDNAFKATAANSSLLEKTVDIVRLPLPPRICGWINSLLASGNDPWRWEPESLRDALQEYFAEVEEEVGSGTSLARVRNYARARLREVTQDTSKTMLLCADTFGLSTAPLYYANVPVQELEDNFRKAMWPLLGDAPSPATAAGSLNSGRVGSQLLVTETAARDLARSPSAPMHASGKSRIEDRRRVQDHNALTNHVLCMLMAIGGHRPTIALLELTRFDFDTEQPAAIFSDKQCDPAHLFRYTPTADLIAKQIDLYLSHLRGSAREAGNETLLAQRARQSLLGDAPIFFHLAPDGAPAELDMASWRATLPSNWAALPLNWGRTWLASRGREAGIESDHLAIVLGHLEATGYPYSRESPLEPAQLSRAVSGPLGHLARSAGWVLRKGLSVDGTVDEDLVEAGPLRNWKRERQELAAQMRQFKIEVEQARRSQMRSKREEGERVVYAILREAVSVRIPTFGELVKLSPGCAEWVQSDHGVRISPDDMEDIESRVESAAGSDRILAMAAHNALYRYVKRAVERLHWESPIPSPWLTPSTQEPSPFFPGLFRATTQIRILRKHFGRILPRPSAGSGFTDFEWACGISAMALCLFSFEDDTLRVRDILSGRDSISCSSAIDDLLLLKTDDRARSAGVRSLAAVALGRLRRDHPSEALPTPARLDEVLAAQMPAQIAGHSAELLGRLCATVEIANRVELSGLARLANSRLSGCVNKTIARQRQFLEEGWGAVESLTLSSDRESGSSQVKARTCKPSEVKKDYRRLRDALNVGTGPKKFKLTGDSLSQANIGAFRGPLQRELEALLSEEKLSPLVACIAAYSLHMTAHGTPEKRDPAWTTVYRYITSFGSELVAQACDTDFMSLDTDEYLDIYQGVIDRKSTNLSKELTARQLACFHAYLHEHHAIESVDFSDLEGVIIAAEHQVDADVIQPQEMVQGIAQMSELALASEQEIQSEPSRVRLDRQSLVFAILLRTSGARHNELAALRFKDILASPESTILLIRSSRYRRLKTSAGRRIIDGSRRLSRQQRQVVSDWLDAEKARLGKTWKRTLPIFGDVGEPKMRVAPRVLRDMTLESLASATGSRSRVHRVRHLVAAEDLTSLWLSGQDWRALRRSRARVRRFVVGRRRSEIVLPRDIREQGIRFGHRRSSTTVLNYFHMAWMTKSRASSALQEFETRHAAAVALGASVAGADKILQRRKSIRGGIRSDQPISAWLSHVAGERTATPGNSAVQLPESPADRITPPSARLVSRMLRDIQRGLPFEQAVLVYGFNRHQADILTQAVNEIEKRTAFRFLPRPDRKGKPRTARAFESARPADLIIDLLDAGSAEERALVRDLALNHLVWAHRSRRDIFVWPVRAVNRMTQLLRRAGVDDLQLRRFQIAGEAGFEKLVVLRAADGSATMNHTIAWALVVTHATLMLS
ncbi:hypothetical protein [Pseudoxanthomonas mexicana]|uniref:hypothetical protein n=1 Tax=Pseudoxanthomonas mexicana TaxID=128785 RepID=UPI0012EE70C0|nr:hypothetical protein [Pseudoxanthomonas mexicana]